MAGEQGTCGFCGCGDGWLGDMGDETTQYLSSSVRVGDPGEWTYEAHPNAWGSTGAYVTWCGRCLGGLAHKFQRYDDHNLHAEHMALKFWLELDGPRWGAWEAQTDEEKATARKYQDDTAIHVDKLGRERRVADIQNELFRRAGFDLTTRGWRK